MRESQWKKPDKVSSKPKSGRQEREAGGRERFCPNLEQPQGISFLQRGMEIWVRLA
jgi:hypothetical protein